jgi:hypothetical protein
MNFDNPYKLTQDIVDTTATSVDEALVLCTSQREPDVSQLVALLQVQATLANATAILALADTLAVHTEETVLELQRGRA